MLSGTGAGFSRRESSGNDLNFCRHSLDLEPFSDFDPRLPPAGAGVRLGFGSD